MHLSTAAHRDLFAAARNTRVAPRPQLGGKCDQRIR